MSSPHVYLAMAGDIIHQGHVNIIKEAAKKGTLTVGVLTDEVIGKNKRRPMMNYEQRSQIISSMKGVHKVIPQTTLEYTTVLAELKPDYVFHGDDWREGAQSYLRNQVIEQLKEWGGQLIEVPYTSGISISTMDELIREQGITPEARGARLRELLRVKKPIRVMEAHNGLTGIIVEKTNLMKGDVKKEFDAIWISSLCDSTAKGKPDIELVDYTSRISTVNEILEVTSKPIILDGDTGGLVEHFVYNVRTLERLGVSAIIIEDKVGLKKNSLLGVTVEQTQASIEEFSHKIRMGKQAQLGTSFMIIARIESLILEKGMEDALQRAQSYIDAGADGIMIHSKKKDGNEIKEFLTHYTQKIGPHVPVVAVPTTYNHLTEMELQEYGVHIVIYANHLIRSAYPAMRDVALSILEHERSFEASAQCLPIDEILKLIPERYMS